MHPKLCFNMENSPIPSNKCQHSIPCLKIEMLLCKVRRRMGFFSNLSKAAIEAVATYGGREAEKQYPAPLKRCREVETDAFRKYSIYISAYLCIYAHIKLVFLHLMIHNFGTASAKTTNRCQGMAHSSRYNVHFGYLWQSFKFIGDNS